MTTERLKEITRAAEAVKPYTVKEHEEFGIKSLYISGPDGFMYSTGAAIPAGLRAPILNDTCRQLNAAAARALVASAVRAEGLVVALTHIQQNIRIRTSMKPGGDTDKAISMALHAYNNPQP